MGHRVGLADEENIFFLAENRNAIPRFFIRNLDAILTEVSQLEIYYTHKTSRVLASIPFQVNPLAKLVVLYGDCGV